MGNGRASWCDDVRLAVIEPFLIAAKVARQGEWIAIVIAPMPYSAALVMRRSHLQKKTNYKLDEIGLLRRSSV